MARPACILPRVSDSAPRPIAFSPLLRQRDGRDPAPVTTIELFFDLVFVFAVTQLSQTLRADLTPAGVARVLLLLLAVWWVWIYTSWVTNWLDPERMAVRIALLVLTAAGLLLSVSIPEAFGIHGGLFAGAYVFMQVGRTLFFLWAVRGGPSSLVRNFQRILAWLALSGIFWVGGAFHRGDVRFACWGLALGIELVSPSLNFWVPGLGRSSTADWNVEGGHLAERCSLFVIIALGESLLVTGASFAALSFSAATFGALGIAVLGNIMMWWIYFDTGAERARHRIRQSADPGRPARLAYTYLHIVIVAGIIANAAADEVVLLHAQNAAATRLAVTLGGPFCYLLGNALFKWVTADRRAPPLSHLAGLGLLALLAWPTFALPLPPLQLGAGTAAILALVGVWESVALRASRRDTAGAAFAPHPERRRAPRL